MSWDETTLSYDEIFLDTDNPRIPPLSDDLDQEIIIHDLVTHEKVKELAQSIVRFGGLYPGEKIIIIEEDGQQIVVEGNRRVAAIKLLMKPELSPKRHKKFFEGLSSGINKEEFAYLDCVLAPDRKATIPIVFNKHAKSATLKWVAVNKAIYFYNTINAAGGLNTLIEETQIPRSEIDDLLKRYTVYKLVLKAHVDKKIIEAISNTRAVNITVFERLLILLPKIAERLGVKWEDNSLLIQPDWDEFINYWSRIVGDAYNPVKKDRLTNRTINTDTLARGYLDRMGVPSEPKHGSSPVTINPLDKEENKYQQKEDKKEKKKRRLSGIVPPEIQCEVSNERIGKFVDELKRVSYKRNGNLVSLGLRALLEMLLSYHLTEIEKMGELVKSLRKKNLELKRDYTPSLKEMVKYAANHDEVLLNYPTEKRSLNKLVSSENSIMSIDTMDLLAHNKDYPSDVTTIETLWGGMESIVRTLLKGDATSG
ncbi:MAG: hypothetical protein KAU50_12125 [Candidatus Marinimicrobia bacterium]|nr:hypothetical protein [Candidatus Neomarinimicrobiota bacterium]